MFSISSDGLFYFLVYFIFVEFVLMGFGDLEIYIEFCFRIDCIENKYVG